MEKKKFVLRIDSTTMAALEKWAADEFRSVNGQLEWIITHYLQEKGRVATDKMKSQESKKPTKDS